MASAAEVAMGGTAVAERLIETAAGDAGAGALFDEEDPGEALVLFKSNDD